MADWTLVGRVEPRGKGQRFFIRGPLGYGESLRASRDDLRNKDVYICDNSGRYPSESDDGPLRILRDEPIRIVKWSDRNPVMAEVCVVNGCGSGGSRCGCTIREAVWLIEKLGMSVRVSPDLRDTIAAYGVIASAAGIHPAAEERNALAALLVKLVGRDGLQAALAEGA